MTPLEERGKKVGIERQPGESDEELLLAIEEAEQATGKDGASKNQTGPEANATAGNTQQASKVPPGPDPKKPRKEPKRQVTFKYGKGDPVKIIANDCPGEVTRMLVDDDRLMYEVRYSDLNNCIHDKWFTFEELEPAA